MIVGGGIELRELVYGELPIPTHAHATAGFCLVLDGTYAERYGSRSLECRPGTVTFSPAGAEHCNIFSGAASHCFTIDVAPEWMNQFHACELGLRDPFDCNGGTPGTLAARLLQECRAHDAATTLVVEGLVLELIGEAARQTWLETETKISPAIRRVRELLAEHFLEPLTLADIGTAVGRHPVYLASSFRAAYGQTIGEFVRSLRVARASRDLTESDLPLAEVALAAGFPNQSHFTRVFKQATGLTPAMFRRRTTH